MNTEPRRLLCRTAGSRSARRHRSRFQLRRPPRSEPRIRVSSIRTVANDSSYGVGTQRRVRASFARTFIKEHYREQRDGR